MNLSQMTVTCGDKRFTGEQSAAMALLVYRRFWGDSDVAACAWGRLLQNGCTTSKFMELVEHGLFLEKKKK